MRVLVTRSAEDAKGTAAELKARGHEAHCVPLLEIEYEPNVDVPLHNAQALLVTSANAIRGFANLSSRRDIPVLTVGSASAAATRELGFANVDSADGNISALAAKAARSYKVDQGLLIHLAGTHSAGDLVGELTAQGFEVSRHVVYTARAVTQMPDALKALLVSQPPALDGVLLYSKRTVFIFENLLRQAARTETCQFFSAFCLSPSIADAAKSLTYQRILVAVCPDEPALLALLD